MRFRVLVPVVAVVPLVLLMVCSGLEPAPPAFSGDRAYAHLVSQVALGPRVPGTAASEAARDYYYRFFDSLGLAVDSQAFVLFDPYSKREIPLVNVIARHPGIDPEAGRVVLMAHYDSRPRTDYAEDTLARLQPIDGANDGASGVAVLMELAHLMAQKPPPAAVDLVLVDGEDWGKVGDNDLYLLGSREFARRGVGDLYEFGIVVDMVGDADQQVFREAYSERYSRPLNDMIWKAALGLGISTFRDTVKHTMMDDHLSLQSAGIPAVLLIDFDYPYWHTPYDTSDKCSASSLENVGRVLAEVIYKPSLWP